MNKIDMFLLECPTYNDYLNSFSLTADTRYLRNAHYCRMLVKLGYRSATAVYTPEQFETYKANTYESLFPTKKSAIRFSEGMTTKDLVLRELAAREQPNMQQVISTIIFIKMRRKSGFEISGYIDYEQSLRNANRKAEHCLDWAGIFQERVLLEPSPTNLSYYDWKRGVARYNDSDNYVIMHDVKDGLIFMHRGDHKKICVDLSKKKYAKNFTSSIWYSDTYGYVILYDHVVRKKI